MSKKPTPPATLYVVQDGPKKPECECGHREETHYGTDARHCNSQGCPCQAWEPC